MHEAQGSGLKARRRLGMLVVAVMLAATPAMAQQRPLVTEDPETVGDNRLLVEVGADVLRDATYPVSGLGGNLFRFPSIGLSVGIGAIAEVQIDGGLYQRLSITDRRTAPLSHMVTATGDTTSSVEDMVVGTKVRLISEGTARPAIALRSATRIPNASNESGLGLDTFDFYSTVLFAKTIQSVRVVGNIGLGILSDPTRGDRQNDVVMYGVSFARAISSAAEVVGEVNGRKDTRSGEPPPGTESRSMARFGARYTTGGWRGDAALMFGLTSADPSFGFTAGFTYVFTLPKLP